MYPKITPPSPDNLVPDPAPSEEDLEDFHSMCVISPCLKYHQYLQDYDFNYLLMLLNQFDLDLTAEKLKLLIDWHDANHIEGLLWCWGPNGVVRRREENWPQPSLGTLAPMGDGSGNSSGHTRANEGSDEDAMIENT